MKIFKMREKNITKRAVAFIMAFAMVISIMLPSGAGLSLNAASSNTLLVDITSLVEADVKDVPSQRDSAFGVDITYTIPQSNYGTAYDSSYDEIIWIYDLTTFISSYPELSNIVDKSSGSIVEGNTERGTYTISGNKVYLDVNKDWLESVIHPTAGEASPASISGTFSMDVKLDAKEIGSKDSISFKFPGAQTDTTLQFPNGSNVQTSKNVIGENGGNVSVSANPDGTYNIAYIVTVTPSTYEKDSLHVMDQLNNSSQNYIPGSFMVNVDGKNIDVSSYTTISGQSADTNLFAAMQDNNVEISAGKSFNLNYTTTIPASELGKELVNSVYATWGTDKSSSPVSKTVTPKSELMVTKAYSYVDQDAKIFKYTITIGDATTDLSGLNIKDSMKDLQKLLGDIKLNGNVINPSGNTFTDTTFVDGTAELFNYTTSSTFGMGPITIEYNVQIPSNDEAPNIDGTRTITNAVDVSNDKYTGHDDSEFTNDFQEIGVGKVTKSFVSFDTANNIVNWNIAVTNDGDNALVDAYVTDTASANTLDNIYDYQSNRVVLDTSSIVVTDGSGNAVPSSAYRVEDVPYSDSKKIVFTSIPAHTTYNVAISSSPKTGDLVNGVTYRNNAELYNKNQTQLGSDNDDKTFEDTSGALSVNKSCIYNKTDKTFDWYVVINENNTIINPDQALYFVDELPEGMEFVTGSMKIKATGKNSKGYTFWDNEFPATPNVSGNKIGPVDVSSLFSSTWIGSNGYVGISGVCTVVTYKTKLTDAELENIKGTYGYHRYSNTFKVTDSTGTNIIAQDTDTAVYEYSFLTKTDLSPADLPDNDYIKFNIDVNPDALTLNNGNPLTLKDNLSTSIELMTNKSGEQGFTIKDEKGKNLLASGDATLSYNDDNRLITMTIPDSTHVIVGYSTRTRGLGDINVVNSAELIGSSSLDSDSTSENHKVSHHSATIGAGKLCLHKIDENDIFKELSDAKFDVYKLELDSNFNIIGETKLLENVTGASGYYYFDSAEFAEGSVYCWKEVHAPSGYELDSTPHYFNFYKEDSNTALVNNPSYIAADELDSKVTNANGITVAKIPFNYTWTVCNTKSLDVFGSFSVTKALAKADTLENKYFTDTVKAKEFTAVITVEVPDGKTPITGSVSIASGKTADFSLVSGSSRKSSATVSIKDGEVYTINNLPIGTTYTVTEADLNQADTKLGFEKGTVTGGTNNDGTGTVENINTVSTVTLNNIYNPKGSINVTKKFVSPQNTNDTFYFALYSVKVPQNETLVTGSVKSVNVTGSVAGTTADVSWDDIPYGTYKVYETDSTGAVITSSPYTVIDNGLSVEVNKASVNAGIITNTESQVVGELSVSKTVSSDLASDKNKEFDFTVTLGDTSITGIYGDMSFTNGVATFSLKNGESKSATGLPQGTVYTVVEAEDNDFTTTKTGDTGTISSTATSTAAFTNVRKTGKLTLSKTVASSVASDKTKAFSFTITLTPAVSTDKITGTFGDVTFTNNVATFNLKDGESKSATGLPQGTTYTVTETADSDFDITKTGDTGTISSTATSTAAFTNARKTGELKVSKSVVSNDNSDFNTEFSFQVELNDTSINGTFGDMSFVDGISTFTLKGGESAESSGLPVGVGYTVTEVADSDFVTTKTGDTGTISSTKSEVYFTNTKVDKYGSFKIKKYVTENGQTTISNDVKPLLAGTYTFTVYTDQACTHTYKNAAGNDLTIDLTIPASCAAVTSSEVTNILEGDYWIKETVPSYSVPVTNPVKITVAKDKTGNNSPVAEFTNNIVTKETSLTASKTLSGREFMTGDSWTFTVTAPSGTPMPANTSVTINPTSGSSADIDFGTIKFTTADIGKTYTYTITESGTVDYVTNDSAKTVSVSVASDGNGGLTITKSTDTTPAVFTNIYSDERVIKVSKVDIANGDEVAGATIQILDENGNVVKDSNGNDIEWVSNTTPKEIYGLKVGVLYTLREVVAPDGYTIATDTNFKINYDGSIDNNVTNGATVRNDGVVLVEDTKTKVSISKMDVVNDKELPGATIQILDSQGNKVEEWISTSAAHVIEGLKTGETYTLKETVAPNGFQIATETTFTLDEYGNIDSSKTTTTQNSNGVLLVEDWPQGSIVINKEGLINETCGSEPNQTVPLEGVEFTLEKPGDASFTSITKATDANGIATFTNLDAGKYTITETKTIGEYIVDTNTYSAEIDAKGNYSGLKKSNGDAVDGNKLTNDQTRGDIEFVKVNLDDPSETLAGSTYGLYTTKGELYGRTGKQLSAGESKDDLVEIAEAATDSAGKIKFTGVLSNVEYTVQEKVAPNGFYVSEKPMKLKITKNANGNTQMILVDDGNGTVKIDAQGNITWLEPEVKVSFLKTDEAGKPLAGAKLKVVDENGKDVISWTSTSVAYDVTGKIVSGKSYKLVETEAPSGYEIADPVSFTVSLKAGEKGADVIQVTMKDVKTPTKSENPTTSTTTPGTTPDTSKDNTSKKDSTGTPDKQTSVTTPSSPAAPNKPNTVVDTGDSNPIIPIAIVLLVAVIGIVVIIIFKKKTK